jgi:hypothetical protein
MDLSGDSDLFHLIVINDISAFLMELLIIKERSLVIEWEPHSLAVDSTEANQGRKTTILHSLLVIMVVIGHRLLSHLFLRDFFIFE